MLSGACGGSDSARTEVPRAGATNSPVSPPSTIQTSNGVTDTALTPQHHSKVKGALLGAVAGGLIAGKRGAMAGAAAGAEMQHHRNKVQAEQAARP
jgi:outer membrane lipoprotein SlyB